MISKTGESSSILRNSNDFTDSHNETTFTQLAKSNDFSMADQTFNNQSSIDRINQMVMQSVERVKRMGMMNSFNFGQDNGLATELNAMHIKDSMNAKSSRRFSINSIKTQRSNIVNQSGQNDTIDIDCSQMNELQDMPSQDAATPARYFVETPLSPNNDVTLHEEETLNRSSKITELPSIYFKPSEQTGVPNDANMFMSKAAENYSTNNDSMFPSRESQSFEQPADNSMFSKLPNQQADMFELPPQCFNEIGGDDSMFKPAQQQVVLESGDQFGGGEESQFFKSGDVFMNELADAEQENRKEFGSNELTVLSSNDENKASCLDSSSNAKWWNMENIQQTSKLEITRMSCSFQQNLSNEDLCAPKQVFAVDDYFKCKSQMPHYLVETAREHGVCLDTAEKIPQKPASEPTLSDDNESDLSNFTLSSTNNVLATTGRVTSNNFSFTFNSSETGEFIQPKSASNSVKNCPATPFQITKMVADAAKSPNNSKVTASNLKTIGILNNIYFL